MNIQIRPDRYATGGNCFVATDADIPGSVGYGDTLNDALADLDGARQALTGRSDLPSVRWFTGAPSEGKAGEVGPAAR